MEVEGASQSHLPFDESPLGRFERVGKEKLTNAELLAILLEDGRDNNPLETAWQMITRFGNIRDLDLASVYELVTSTNISPEQAARIHAGVEFGRRVLATSTEDSPLIASPNDAVSILMPSMQDLAHEEIRLMLLNTRGRLMKTPVLYKGGVNTLIVRPADFFRSALRENAVAFIMAHNHPSGDPQPSPEDVNVTRQVIQAGNLLGISVLDHIVIGRGQYVSMRERGLAFGETTPAEYHNLQLK